MAIVEIPGGVFLPAPIQFSPTGTLGFATYTLNGTNRKIGFILRAPRISGNELGTIGVSDTKLERFEFMIGVVAQNPANGLKVSFTTVSTGNPVNTADWYYVITTGNISVNTWTIPPYITTDGTNTGDRKTIEHGDLFACVIEFNNYSSGDSLQIKVLTQDLYAMKGAYTLTADSLGAWTKVTGMPVMALVYQTPEFVDTYMPLSDAYAIESLPFITVDPNDEPDEVGLAFTLPAPMRVGGAYVMVSPSDDFDVVLYDIEANQEVERINVTTDDYYPNGNNIDYVYVRFTQDWLLQGNQIYILSVAPSGAGTVDVYYATTLTAAQMASLPGGSTWYYAQRVDAGDWAEQTRYRPIFGLQITGVDHDTSGGSGGTGWQGNP